MTDRGNSLAHFVMRKSCRSTGGKSETADPEQVESPFHQKAECSIVLTSDKMQVRLLFFATLKDIVGAREISVELPLGATVSDVLTHLEKKYPRVKDYRPVVLTAVNEEYVKQSEPVQDGDEVAIFPPVSGG